MTKDRRRFLQTLGLGAVGALAGCGGDGGGDTTTTPAPTDTTTETTTTTPEPTDTTTETTTTTPEEPTEVITVTGGGEDIWDAADAGHFYYAEVSGDFDVRAEVISVEETDRFAKGGIMARPSLEAPAQHVYMRKYPGDRPVSPQWRTDHGAEAASVTSGAGQDLAVNGGTFEGNWQRLQREGDTIRAFGSADGEEWTLLAELTPAVMEMPDTVLLGLAVTSHNSATTCDARFRNLEGVEPSQNDDIGDPLGTGSVSVTENVPIVETAAVSEPSASAATLRGTVRDLGEANNAAVTFEYRDVPHQEWTEAGTETISSTGEVSLDVSGLTPRRYYEYRLTIDNGEITSESALGTFSTPGPGDGGTSEGPDSASAFDPSDGFAGMASWLDNDTPLIVVDEPTRDQLQTALNFKAPRVVAFATSGTIDLGGSEIAISGDKCWLAGQTAPSPGITLIRGSVVVDADDCVVQHVRSRPGDAGRDSDWQNDPIVTADGSQNNVIDHCTATWSIDENLSVGYDTTNTTVTNCLVAEPLNNSLHPKGPHGYNSLIGNNAKNVTMAGNIWAFSTDRNPRLKTGTETVIANNLVHHHHVAMATDRDTSHSIVGNAFEDPLTNDPNILGSGRVYAEDNVQLDDASVPMVGSSVRTASSRPLWPTDLSAISSGETKSHNLENAGARPADRTDHDERILANLRNGEGRVIDSQEDVGGYPDLAENTHEISIPASGLRAWLRERARAVEP